MPSQYPVGSTAHTVRMVAAIAFNVFSSVSLVTVMKFIFSTFGFQHLYFLTFLHQCVTGLVMFVAGRYFKLFEIKELPHEDTAKAALLCVMSICFGNLSLRINAIGVYQILKILVAPTIVLIESLVYFKVFSNRVKLALLVSCIGVGMATVGDLGSSVWGLMAGLCMCLATAGCQVYQTQVMRRCEATPQQMLVYTGPFAGLMLLVSMPALEDMGQLMSTEWSSGLVFAIALTCLGAAAVNLSVLMILDYSSPLTNQMVGHLKTCLVIFIGQALFGATITLFTVFGLIIALSGITWYGKLRREENAIEQAKLAKQQQKDGANAKASKDDDAKELGVVTNIEEIEQDDNTDAN